MTDLKIVPTEMPKLMRYRSGGKYHIHHLVPLNYGSVHRPLCASNVPATGVSLSPRRLVDTPIGLLCQKCKKKLPVGTYHFHGGVYTVYPNGTRSLAPDERAEQLVQGARAKLATVAKNGRDVVHPASTPKPVRKETNTERAERYKAFSRGVAQSVSKAPAPTKPVAKKRQTIGDMLRKR